jgi:hypothetical protein
MKVNNEVIWNDFVKTGKVKGFSIEGYFSDKLEMSLNLNKKEMEKNVMIEKIKSLIEKSELKNQKVKLGTIQDAIKIVDIAEKEFEDGFLEVSFARSKAMPMIKTAIANAEKFLTQFEQTKKTAKELGVDLPADYLKQEMRASTVIGEAKDIITWLNKY